MTDNETTADIIAEYRQRAMRARKSAKEFDSERIKYQTCKVHPHCNRVADILRDAKEYDSTADRLEAALKREMSKNASKNGADFGQLGNAAKLREALETVRKYVKETTPDKVMLGVIEVWCDEALAEPVRNCDVGTAEEQEVRFDGFCMAHKEIKEPGLKVCSDNCPFVKKGSCDLHWAQLPYEEGGAK